MTATTCPVPDIPARYVEERRHMETVVYIPARRNSSRVPKKNIAPVGGLPLMAYTILMARALDGVDRVFVDTDSEEFAEVARAYGAEVPFLRDPRLAGDRSALGETTQRFQERVFAAGLCTPERFITMMPTSPFRNLAALRRMLAAMDRYTGVFTLLRADVDLGRSRCRSLRGESFPIRDLLRHEADQYDWGKLLGYFLGGQTGWRRSERRVFYNNFLYWPLTNPIELVDVDVPADLELVRRIVDAGIYDFGMDLRSMA